MSSIAEGAVIIMRFWPVFDRNRTEQWVEDSLRSYAQYRLGLWVLTFKGSDEAIGDCGLAVIKEVEGAAETQIGWHVCRGLWGQASRRRQHLPVVTTGSTT